MAQRRARGRLSVASSSLLCLVVLSGVLAGPPAAALTGSPEQDPVFARELAGLPDGATYDALVHVAPSVERPGAFLQGAGFEINDVFETVDVYHVTGPAGRFRDLTRSPGVVYLEANRQLRYLDESAAWVTGARIAQLPVAGGPYLDATGRPLTGAGVGVAVVDSGVNALHPDLEKRVVRNYKWHCASLVLVNTSTERCYGATVPLGEVPGTTDTSSGHGTHVAGIVAGDGTASQGSFSGTAPGASLYGFGVGEVIFVANAAEAFEFIIANYNDRTKFPVPIKVVNNSWGDDDLNGNPNVEGPAYRANSLLARLTRQLVGMGVTMVYAAGNGDNATTGDDGTHYNTSSTCQDPTPGVICVANYDDGGVAKRDGALNVSSSRGKAGVPATYPDVTAPGTLITSPCIRQAQPICNLGAVDEARWAPFYGTISGTSMAAPHVAGVVAMLLQARPDLTPAQVEDVLLDTAAKFQTRDRLGNVVPYAADPQNPDGTTSYDKGAGMVDVPAALADLGVGGAKEASPSSPITGDGGDFPGPGAADIVGLSVAEQATGMRYTIAVRDVADTANGVGLRLTQLVNGATRLTSVNVTTAGAAAAGPDPARNNSIATDVAVDRDADTVSFLVPFAALGNPGPDTPAHTLFVSSFLQGVVDAAPGGAGPDVLLRPRYGAPYTIHPSSTETTTVTEISFTEASATSGRYSDAVALQARLVEAEGAPVGSAPVTFAIGGQTATAVTGDDGVATATVTLDQPPGETNVTATFDGVPGELASDEVSTGFTVLKEITQVAFGASSQTSGHHSDDATVAAVLTDDEGTPLAGRTVAFSLGDATQNATVEDGAATATFPLTGSAGTYDVATAFEGDELYEPAQAAAQFEILHEVTTLALEVTGNGSKRTLTATLLDDEGVPVAQRTIVFEADGEPMPGATGITDGDGVAVHEPGPGYRGNNRTYSASFSGDDSYAAASSAPPPQVPEG